MPLPPSPIGFDASVIINFWKVDRLDLLVLLTPPHRMALVDVLDELADPGLRPALEEHIRAGDFEQARIESQEMQCWADYSLRLDAGESATLAAAYSRSWSVALDDRAARRIAERDLGSARITGTVGLLVHGVESGIIDRAEGNSLLAGMIAAGFHSPVPTLEDLLSP